MAIVSILSDKPSISVESQIQSPYSTSQRTIAACPLHSAQNIERMLSDIEHTSSANRASEESALALLSLSSHVEGTLGSPGTFLLMQEEGSREGEGRFTAIVVNEHAEKTTYMVKQFTHGWMINKESTVYKSFSALTASLLSGMEDIMGPSSHGIPFLSTEQIASCVDKLSQCSAGTYITFAHTPLNEIAQNNDSISPKRNVILWVNNEGNIEEAQLHFDGNKRQWLNGGPHIGHTAVLSDVTLQGLIEKKIFLSLGRNGLAQHLHLGV